MKTSRLFWLGSSAALMVLGFAGIAAAYPVVAAVPEIDPATATSGLALLAGATLLLLERGLRRR
jgi:hypothetical protein